MWSGKRTVVVDVEAISFMLRRAKCYLYIIVLQSGPTAKLSAANFHQTKNREMREPYDGASFDFLALVKKLSGRRDIRSVGEDGKIASFVVRNPETLQRKCIL